jgi:hypothetical protein
VVTEGRIVANRVLEIDGLDWTVVALPQAAKHAGADPWHYARVRFEPFRHIEFAPRETWLRHEEDVPADDVLDQYGDEELTEAFLVAEEIDGGGSGE